MQCATCGSDNPLQARFCARCGTALAEAPTPTPPPRVASPAIAPSTVPATVPAAARETYRISTASATIAMFAIGLMFGGLLNILLYYGGPFGVVFHLIGTGLGVAASLWLSSRLRLVWRLPSSLGIGLMFFGRVPYGLDFLLVFIISDVVAGLGIGLLFPWAFWRFSNQITRSLEVAMPMAIAAIAGIGVKFWLVSIGSGFILGVATVFALAIGLAVVLISPIVRKA